MAPLCTAVVNFWWQGPLWSPHRCGPVWPPAHPPHRRVCQSAMVRNSAMDNGLTQAQAAEIITHLAFYVGWPNAFSALPVAKDVFEKRPR
jgi:4-carboxymuconolactone decarboxylase